MIRVTVWNEFIHERTEEPVKKIYPNGIHQAIADFLKTDEELEIKTATQQDPEHGLSQKMLDETDVLLYWAHAGHSQITYEEANRVKEAVLKGMGIIFLHSAHASRPFSMLLGTSGSLSWREDGDKTRLWILTPEHPILKGINKPFIELEHEETYAERFDIPTPDELLTITWYEGGEVFRSGCCWKRGLGKIFYFQPGHETYPIYYNQDIQTVIKNAVHWAAPEYRIPEIEFPQIMEKLEK